MFTILPIPPSSPSSPSSHHRHHQWCVCVLNMVIGYWFVGIACARIHIYSFTRRSRTNGPKHDETNGGEKKEWTSEPQSDREANHLMKYSSVYMRVVYASDNKINEEKNNNNNQTNKYPRSYERKMNLHMSIGIICGVCVYKLNCVKRIKVYGRGQ